MGSNSSFEIREQVNTEFITDESFVEIVFGIVKKARFKINSIQFIENGENVSKETYDFVLNAFSTILQKGHSHTLSYLLEEIVPNQVLKVNFVNRNEQPSLTFELGADDYYYSDQVITNSAEEPTSQSYEGQIETLKNEEKKQVNEMPIFIFYVVFALLMSAVSTASAYESGADELEMLAAFNTPLFLMAFFVWCIENYKFDNNQ